MNKKEQVSYMKSLGAPGKELWIYLEDGAWSLNEAAFQTAE